MIATTKSWDETTNEVEFLVNHKKYGENIAIY